METPNLQVGLKIEIWRTEGEGSYVTRIAALESDMVGIAALCDAGTTLLFQPGENVRCVVVDKDLQAQFGFETQIVCRASRNIAIYFMKLPKAFVRIQRRNFVRLPVLIPQLFRRSKDVTWNQGFLLDVSAGGARISHTAELNRGELVQLQFSLHVSEIPLHVKGQVTRIWRVEDHHPALFHSGIRFEALSEASQDLIVGYVFQRMVAARRRPGV